ncbi:L,D-transpeptidase [bacterium]|nr:L,D-transpeptidase [bacterium]
MRTGFMTIFCMLCLPACSAMVDPKPMTCPAEDSVVIGQLDADVTGDGVKDRIILMGRKQDRAGHYVVEMSVRLTDLDGQNELCTRLPEKSGSGINPQLKAMDFTGDGTPDVLISSPTDGGIINCVIYSFIDGRPKLLFDTNRGVMPAVTGHFLSDYKAEIIVGGQSSTVDLADHRKYYDQAGYYNNGKLLKSTEVITGGYGLITPVDVDHNGVYELEAIQEARGISGADPIAEIISHIKWDKDGWQVMDVSVRKTVLDIE